MNRESLLNELRDLCESVRGPFPYDDLQKMRETKRLVSYFKVLGDDDWLSADLNTYFMAIRGLASRLLKGKVEDVPTTAVHWLTQGDFFAIFPKYHFLEDEWEQFSQFAHLYRSTKRMQKIVLALLLTKNELFALKNQNPQEELGHFLGSITNMNLIDEDEV